MIRPQEIIVITLLTIWFVLSVYNYKIKKDKIAAIYYMIIATFMLLALK